MVLIALFLLLALAPAAVAGTNSPATASTSPATVDLSTTAIKALVLADRQVRGIHLTSWAAGSARQRRRMLEKISRSVINTVVVAVKETDGKVYIPGIKKAAVFGSYKPAITAPEKTLKEFKDAGLYTVARIVVFKDQVLPETRPDLAVKTSSGTLWRSRNGATWVDPYNREVWAYILDLAEHCARLGFEEIQFDYIRYPSEGDTTLCRYSKPHSPKAASDNLREFLSYARGRLEPHGVKISADVFGLTTSIRGMGIGQDLQVLAEGSDYVYPMMYPSHYGRGVYGLDYPNAHPFKVINQGLKDARKRLGTDYAKVRPYLQDFSLGRNYGPSEVRAQMIATRLNLLESWVLWNPSNRYTWAALTPQSYRAFVDPHYGNPPPEAEKRSGK